MQDTKQQTEGAVDVSSNRLLGELILTVEEIRHLAEFAGILVTPCREDDKEDERETEITISKWPEHGVWDEDQKCNIPAHRFIATLTEYPEEGCVPLGSPNGKLNDLT